MSMMTEDRLIESMTELVREHARARAKDVARGAETPRLAALMLQKYGAGIVDAAATILDSAGAVRPISEVLDIEVARLDPLWRENNTARWAAKPADLAIDGRIRIPYLNSGGKY